MGIGCSCIATEDKEDWRERKITCIIAVAREVEAKDIKERIPGYMGVYQLFDGWQCKDQCNQLQVPFIKNENVSRGSKMVTGWCADDETPDENGFCQ
jgi:hypothetical protein